MLIRIKDTSIHYIRYGAQGKNPIVLLHGWGQNIEMMKMLGDARKDYNDVVIIDLPGHGESEEPKFAWQVSDFVECIKELLEQLHIENPTLIGHSFGGKISLLYASQYQVNKLILFGSPFQKEIQKESFKLKVLKQAKKVPGLKNMEQFAKKHIGSTDYRNASPLMRNILVNTVNLDITEDVKKITCPTLLVWGMEDREVSIERAYELEQLIKDAGLVVYEGCTHYAYLERLDQTIRVINSFLGEE